MSRRDPHKMPKSGLSGWGAAQTILDRCKDDDRRALLDNCLRRAGVQGAPALSYTAKLLRWHIDEADYPSVPDALRKPEWEYCQRRAEELLLPYVDAGDRRLAKTVRGFTEQAA